MKQSSVAITILADNTAFEPYRAEHGFSAFVRLSAANLSEKSDAGSRSDESYIILFDTGQSVLFENADTAGIDLDTVQNIVLSHGHYDHTNALSRFLTRYPDVSIYASHKILRPHYSLRTGTVRNIALSEDVRVALDSLPETQFCRFSGKTEICGGLAGLAENIPHVHPLEKPSPLLFADEKCTVPDTVPDELVLWVETSAGLVILTGCCHAGFINTCEYVRTCSGLNTIHAVLGGLHLEGVCEVRLAAIAEYIRSNNIDLIIPCHCTGDAAITYLEKELGSIIQKGKSGKRIIF